MDLGDRSYHHQHQPSTSTSNSNNNNNNNNNEENLTMYNNNNNNNQSNHQLIHSNSSFSQVDTLNFNREDSFTSNLPLLNYPSSNSTNTINNSIPPQRVQFSTSTNHPNFNNNDSFNQNQNQQHQRPELTQLNTSNNNNYLNPTSYSGSTDFRRKKSLVRPDRERVDENHRLFNYRNHTAAMEVEGRGVTGVSRTGHYAMAGLGQDGIVPNPAFQDSTNLRRGKSILAREENDSNNETTNGLAMFKRGATLRKPNRGSNGGKNLILNQGGAWEKNKAAKAKSEPLGPWMIFCLAITLCCPSPLLKCFGLRTKERRSAWREKMGLLAIVGLSMAAVGFLTFGFTKSVCGTPALRYKSGEISSGSMIYQGYNYDLDKFSHPAAAGIAGGSNPLYNLFNAASMDGSFLFQTVNQKCLGIITPAVGTGIKHIGQELGWYFPCNLYNQWGTSPVNKTGYAEGAMCHTQANARGQFNALNPLGQVYFNWNDLKNSSRNLGVYNGAVLDFSLLNWLDVSQVAYPILFDSIKNGNSSYRGQDITSLMVATDQRAIAACMVDIIRVGFIDSVTIGCVASDIVLYVSLAVIIGVVVLRFMMAVIFGWFLSWKIGRFPDETGEQRRARAAEIENWTDDIYRPAAARYRPNVANKRRTMLPTTSRFSKGDMLNSIGPGGILATGGIGLGGNGNGRPESKFGDYRKSMALSTYGSSKSMLGVGMRNSPPGSPGGGYKGSRSSTSLPSTYNGYEKPTADGIMGVCPFPLGDIVPQPSADFEPFNYPLSHVFLLVTAYSESVEGLRTTIDSLATTDYPNSHKVILVIADGMVKGSGNTLTTPEIALSMMKELVVPSDEVEALSYVAIADGHKQHNRAKIFAGYYEYDNNTVELSKQQRVPMMLIAKVGNDSEIRDAKPGNRGKRDSQIILMAFLQKVMFDERMSAFEYEFFNSMWRCTGVSPEKYEMVLCVDADTKVFPDSVSRMVSCMVNDPEIMGLCGETKIANKTESWVTMIQVFEYYVSHHLTKAFESVFGGVTCLPGCFSMYRIKSPKGGEGYWVPVLANPDIVEHYSENVVDTLHKKNLLLLGEDRYLTTLMLRTFPRRKMMFCPQAVCKTVVPDTFMVLLSQRRRWINSTVHNLFELFVVPDLCGVFCFSMRFVIFMELVGTLVLPAAISFTIYLIVVTIIPGTVKPVIPLILLAFILGLPGLLIVTTSRKFAYLGWMMIYLLSLPIWNLVLPLYAFFHMDDFSWGETRKIVGDTGQAHSTDKVGLFDSSHIVMKRWADFERDRRYKSGSQSRDSIFDNIPRSSSPGKTSSNRYSVISSADTFNSTGAASSGEALFRRSSPATPNQSNSELGNHSISGPRYPTQIELPAPLANSISSPSIHSPDFNNPSTITPSSSQIHNHYPYEVPLQQSNYNDSNSNLPNFPRQLMSGSGQHYPKYEPGYDSDEVEREAILGDFGTGDHSPILTRSPILGPSPISQQLYSSNQQQRPEREQHRSPTNNNHYVEEPESLSSSSSSSANLNQIPVVLPILQSTLRSPTSEPRKPRGVSLVDSGPVPGSEGMRVVQRQRRHDSQSGNIGSPISPIQSPRSRNSLASTSPITGFNSPPSVSGSTSSPSLPPGAAPPHY